MRAIPRHNTTRSGQMQGLTDASTVDKTDLEKANMALEAANSLLEHRVRYLQVAVTILLAICGGVSTGLTATIIGTAAQTAFGWAITVFFALIMASMAILNFMGR